MVFHVLFLWFAFGANGAVATLPYFPATLQGIARTMRLLSEERGSKKDILGPTPPPLSIRRCPSWQHFSTLVTPHTSVWGKVKIVANPHTLTSHVEAGSCSDSGYVQILVMSEFWFQVRIQVLVLNAASASDPTRPNPEMELGQKVEWMWMNLSLQNVRQAQRQRCWHSKNSFSGCEVQVYWRSKIKGLKFRFSGKDFIFSGFSGFGFWVLRFGEVWGSKPTGCKSPAPPEWFPCSAPRSPPEDSLQATTPRCPPPSCVRKPHTRRTCTPRPAACRRASWTCGGGRRGLEKRTGFRGLGF